jgi:hypothetical protein
MISVASHESILESLEKIRQFVSPNPADKPAQFVLDLARPSKERGGTVAAGTIFIAAIRVLGLRSPPAELSIDAMKIDPAHAIEKLRHHGFRLLGLDEFMWL